MAGPSAVRDRALAYHQAGLAVLPARLPDKRPAIGTWKPYQSRLPTVTEVAAWFANSHDGCCLICGAVSGNLELIDFDCAGEAFAAWSHLVTAEAPDLLDRLVVETSPSGGWHVVYRCAVAVEGNLKLASRREDVDSPVEVERFGKTVKPRKDKAGRWHLLLTLIETRGEGGLFLCAPTPRYTLMQGDFTALPVITPDEREILLGCARALHQVAPELVDGQPFGRSEGLRPGDDYNASADLPGLLQQYGWTLDHIASDGNEHWCRPGKPGGTSATLRDRVFYVFSSNAAPFEPGRAYNPFAVLSLLEFGGDFAAAARALRQYGFGDQAAQVDLSGLTGSLPAQPVEPPEPEVPDPGPVPVELLQVPGFVGQVMDFCLATAPYPNPVLAFCGAMSLQATLAGRRVRDEGDNRSNLYLLGLANSGAGKDHPRKLNQRILLEAGLANQVGDAFASAEGIEDRMLLTPCMLFQTDEMDALLLSIREGKDGRSERIMQALLKFYTSANAIYPMRVKAGKEPEFINQPCLSVFGTAIPQHFYESLSAKMLSNGFFARMLVLEAGKRGTGQRATTPPIPATILDTARWWRDFQPGTTGNLGAINPAPAVIATTADAQVMLDDIRHQAERDYTAHEAKGDQMGMAIWARAAEKVHRLALCYACSENHQDPMIAAKAVEWAWKLTEHQTRRMIAMATVHVYESDFDQKQKRAIQAIRARGGSLSQEQMTRALRTLPARERDEVLGNLLATGQVVLVSEQTGGRPRTLYRIPTLDGKSVMDGKSNA